MKIEGDNIAELIKAFAKAQSEMGGTVGKNSQNPFFKSSYADLGAVLGMAIPILSKNGLVLTQSWDTEKEGKVEIITIIMHEGGATLKGVCHMICKVDGNNVNQAIGSAVSYGRRYHAAAMLGIAQADDDGNNSGEQVPTRRK